MADPVEPLIADLLEWLEPRARPYDEVLAVWRTSCPRLPVWEEATERGFVERVASDGGAALVGITPLGRGFVQSRSTSATRVVRTTSESSVTSE